MKLLTKFLITTIAITSSLTAHAEGFGAGNSGTVVICRDPATGTETTTLLDLWEYTADPHRNLTLNISDARDEESSSLLASAINRLLVATGNPRSQASFLRSILEDELEHVGSHILLATFDGGTHRSIQYPAELLPPVRDPHCTYESVISYQRDGRLITNQDLTSRIFRQGEVPITALFLHEAIYRIARDFRDVTDSIYVRELVAHLLSAENNQGRIRYLALMLLTPPTDSLRFRIPHAIERTQGQLDVRLQTRSRRGKVTCQVSAQFLTENGVPFSHALRRQEVALESGEERVVPLEIVRSVSYGEYKVNQYQLRVELDCDRPERITSRRLAIPRSVLATENYDRLGGLTGYYRVLQDNESIPLSPETTIVSFR